MEVIKKIISIDSLKSHQFSLIPYDGMGKIDDKYILSKNGNWGKYPFDIDITKCGKYSELNKFFGNKDKVSFSQIIDKWRQFENLFKKTSYKKKIRNNNTTKWANFEPYWSEKISLSIFSNDFFYSSEGEEYITKNNYRHVGIYSDNSFFEWGGTLMIEFLLKAIGIFVVEKKFIKNDNYIPEIMYYMEIEEYMDKINSNLKQDFCCNKTERLKYGNEEFYTWLSSKINDRNNLFKFWCNALYLGEDNNPTNDIYIPLSLTEDYRNIGMFDEIYETDIIEEIQTFDLSEDNALLTRTYSRLKELKREKISYGTIIKEETVIDENGNYVVKTVANNIELPVILNENGDNSFILTPKYVIGCPKNLQEVNDEFYGDVIYKIEEKENGYADIYYVIGGKLIPTIENQKNGDYGFLNTYQYVEESKTGIKFVETVKYEEKDYTKEEIEIRQLFYDSEVNILKWGLVKNVKNVKIYYDVETENLIEGEFYMSYQEPVIDANLIMHDYNFGKTENLIENIEDVIIDRGYISAFELHYKLGEINTFEDLQNYQNNIFGL